LDAKIRRTLRLPLLIEAFLYLRLSTPLSAEYTSDEHLPLNPLAGFVFQQLISYDRLGEGSG